MGKMLVLFMSLVCAGCGYHTGSLMSDKNIRAIHVQNFRNSTFDVKLSHVNRTSKFGIESKLTDEVMRRFMLDGTLKVTSKEASDVIMEGEVTGYSISPRSFDETDRRIVAAYGISITAEVRLLDSRTGEIFWVDDISKGATYYLTGSIARSEEDAVTDAMLELARDIVIRTVEGW